MPQVQQACGVVLSGGMCYNDATDGIWRYRMKRRILALALCMALLAGLLTGCAKQKAQQPEQDDAFSIYASFYPIYAIAGMITENVPDVRLNCLVQPQDGCLRDYALSDWDLALLGSADAVLIGGRKLESFESLLYTLGEDGPGVSALLYNMDLSGFNGIAADEDSHWYGENPHIYMKSDGAIALAERISGSLSLLDAKNSDQYAANIEAAKQKLAALQAEIHEQYAHLAGKSAIVMNEALLYVAEELGLKVESYIERESGEGFYDSSLAQCLEELESCEGRVILIEKQAPAALCEALEDAGFVLARLDTFSTRTAGDGPEGYFETLRMNAAAISAAFVAGEDIA